jgi:integrase/recombinase XerD
MTKRISVKGKEVNSINDAKEQYLYQCKIRNLASTTIDNYIYNIDYFINLIGYDTLCKEIQEETIQDFILHLQEKYENKVTVVTIIKAVRSFIYCCQSRGWINKFEIKLPKVQQKIKETYTDEELKAVLKKPTKNTYGIWRNWAIVNFLIGTGCRVTTCINVKIQDIDFDNNMILLTTTKNKKQQLIPLSGALKNALRLYLSKWEHNETSFLFCDSYGKQLTDDNFKKIIQRYNNSRGVTKTSSHAYRHTFAKAWILNGGDIFRLQKILGHSTMEMVRKYVNMYSSDLQIGFDNFNPLDNLQKNNEHIKLLKK